ncbi:M23 family metallopeptidase [Agromyces sp. SYSU K20354]|nr:M23 family metallopeptidase [Agromyces cavernae]
MAAAFGQGRDLLAGLSGVARVTEIAGDAEKLLEITAERDAEAVAAEARAVEAWAAVDEIDIEALEKKVDRAERAVTSARKALSGLQTRVASAGVAFVQTLPQDSGLLSDQGWSVPVSGDLTDGFGPRPNKPLPGVNEFHRGTDISAGCREPVFAATAGTVVQTGPNGTYGNWVLIDHGSGISTGYAHLIDGGTVVKAGQTVKAGQLISAVGSTGASTGCHLHFEVRIDGTAVNAIPFMAARGVALG